MLQGTQHRHKLSSGAFWMQAGSHGGPAEVPLAQHGASWQVLHPTPRVMQAVPLIGVQVARITDKGEAAGPCCACREWAGHGMSPALQLHAD